jgi:hypothetical protein
MSTTIFSYTGPGDVVILNEMVHNARIVPSEGRAHLSDGIRPGGSGTRAAPRIRWW